MDANHAKALWFRGRSYMQIEEFDNAIATLVRLCKVEP
jgi:cytochrome c-type biogenesis protein CcmH/NrfG